MLIKNCFDFLGFYTEYNNLTFHYIQDILDKKDNRFDVKGLTNA